MKSQVRKSAPRARGDGPPQRAAQRVVVQCSPRSRGWSRLRTERDARDLVLPALAGMVPSVTGGRPSSSSAPRARGDGPRVRRLGAISLWCSPRSRGWSRRDGRRRDPGRVLPALAGMVPSWDDPHLPGHGAPRARGDGPRPLAWMCWVMWCSPRSRGWSPSLMVDQLAAGVLPALAGMVRWPVYGGWWRLRAPRARGDGPWWMFPRLKPIVCSPRSRGWSSLGRPLPISRPVLPALAGMVPSSPRMTVGDYCAPRARGDGPKAEHYLPDAVPCSPRSRGWSQGGRHSKCTWAVLPALAGMVPAGHQYSLRNVCAPRARGDGPEGVGPASSASECSPRSRGWSRADQPKGGADAVLPALAGMVPRPASARTGGSSAPRARGDGPIKDIRRGFEPECSPRSRGWSLPAAAAPLR